MSQLKSGASADLLSVDATSKAARFTEYETNAETELLEAYPEYMVSVDMVWSLTGGGAGAYQFVMRNTSSTKRIKLKKCDFIVSFYGTAAASNQQYTLQRYPVGFFTSVSAGVSLTAIPELSTNATSMTQIFMADGTATTPLAATISQISAPAQSIFNAINPRSLTSKKTICYFDRDLEILPGQALGIISPNAGVIGDVLNVILYWEEI
jgi:hypothetical protein